MNYLDDECEVIRHFQEIECSSVFFPVETVGAIDCFEKIHDIDNWDKWVNTSGKADSPPDFYSNEFKYMMDVMRVDDHAFINKKGKLVNPTNMKESVIQKELVNSGLLQSFPNAKIIVNPDTKLATHDDHNYGFYRDNFLRTIEHHKTKIKMYRKNHSQFKLVFFVMDESSAYFEKIENHNEGIIMKNEDLVGGKPHLHFWDEDFLESIEGTDIDYLVWYSPYKLLRSYMGILDLPKVCVLDIKSLDFDKVKYSCVRMASSEV